MTSDDNSIDNPIPWRIETHEAVSSTQDRVKARALAGEGAGLVVQARSQSAGRGRQGTHWTSPPGNLYMSVLLWPDCPAEEGGAIALVCAVALARAVAPFVAPGARVGLKWPNDLLIDGRKAAGILVESEMSGARIGSVVAGFGVNVGAAPEGAAALAPGALVDEVRDAVLVELAKAYGTWRSLGFSPIRAAWLERADRLGEVIRVGKPPHRQEGVFLGLSAAGRLIFQPLGGDVREISAGPVFYGDDGGI